MKVFYFCFFLLSFFILSNVSAAITCDSGTTEDNCLINSTKYFSDGELFNGTGNLIIETNGSIVNYSRGSDGKGFGIVLNFSSITINSGGNISGGNITVYSTNITINTRAMIYTKGLGYNLTNGPGAGGSGSNVAGGGAGHGGYGGRGYYTAYTSGGLVYGSSLSPNSFGSGGGRRTDGTASFGEGGGIIFIIAETLTLNGTLVSDATNGVSYAGGGAGGSIYLDIVNFYGTGNFSAKGGNGVTGLGTGSGASGGGSGGRIAVYYNYSTFTGLSSSSAIGGTTGMSAENGRVGTMLIVDKVNNSATIKEGFRFQGLTTIANETGASNKTFWNTNNPNFFNFSVLNITNATIIASPGFYINLSAESLFFDSNSQINLNGLSDYPGRGAGSASTYAGGGGGHSGTGGSGYVGGSPNGVGGASYDSSFYPTLFGSYGANNSDTSTYQGGAGGGAILINTRIFVFDGLISANGTAGGGSSAGYGRFAGGGSGGSILIIAGNISGSGKLTASGGGASGGGSGSVYAGGGAGGRVAVYYNYSTFTGISRSDVSGGISSSSVNYGSTGSLIFVNQVLNSAEIYSGFRFQGLTTIANESTNTTFWNTANPTILNFSSLNITNAVITLNNSLDLYSSNIFLTNVNWACSSSSLYLKSAKANTLANNNSIGGCSSVSTSGKPTYNAPGSFDGSGTYMFDGFLDYIATSVSQTKTTYSFWYKNLTGNWIHVVNSNGINYTNGILGNPSQYPIYVSGNDISIGKVSSSTFFSGSIDQVQIFNRALSASEILNLYNGTINNSRYIGKYNLQGDFKSLVFYNSTSSYWNATLSTADTTGRSGIVNTDNSINLSNPNLVSYWALDNNLNDAKGRNNGTCTGTACPNNATGLSSNAMRFDGVDDYINTTNHADNLTNMSISLWIYHTKFPETYISKISGTSAGKGWYLYSTLSNVLGFYKQKDGSNYYGYLSTGTMPINQWYHIAVTMSGSNIEFYLNGQNISKTLSSAGTVNDFNNNLNVMLGYGSITSSAYYPNGTIDEVLIYNTSLSASDVQKLYKSGLSQHANTNITLQTRTGSSYNVSDVGLVGLWGMNGYNFSDSKGTNQGLPQNGVKINKTSCKIGNCAQFDGVDDYVQLPVGTSSKGLSKYSFSAWVKVSTLGPDILLWESTGTSNVTARRNYQINASGALLLNGRASDSDSSTNYAWSNSSIISTNTWYFVTFVYDTDGSKVYLNGIDRTVGTNTASAISNTNPLTNPQIMASSINGVYTNGTIDEVAIYNRSLSQAEITALYNSGTGTHATPDANLVSTWYFDEDEIIGTDLSNNNNQGGCSGTTCPTYNASGIVAGGYYVANSNTKAINVTRTTLYNFTLSGWTSPIAWYSNNQHCLIGDTVTTDALAIRAGGAGQLGYIWVKCNSDTNKYGDSVNIPLGRWVHLAVTGNSSGIYYYINGVYDGTDTACNNFSYAKLLTCSLGSNGYYDEIRVYNRSLSASEIQNLYELGSYHINWNNNGAFSSEQTCYANETQIMTEEGWKLFSELSRKEKVATLNPETKKIEYKLPSEYQEYNAPEFMYRIKTSAGELVVSPEHKVYASIENNEKWSKGKIISFVIGIILVAIGLFGLWKVRKMKNEEKGDNNSNKLEVFKIKLYYL